MNYGIDHLHTEDVLTASQNPNYLHLSPQAEQQISTSYQHVQSIIHSGKVVYGINTGFGPLCDTQVTPEETALLQRNLILSHSVGVGEFIDPKFVKVMMIGKIHALSKGYSGISLGIVKRLILMLEKNIIPCIPKQGSVGASGDLAPLSHMVLPILGKGKVFYQGNITESAAALRAENLEPIELQAKEGLALINGTQFILAHSIIGLDTFKYLLDLADVCAALSLEAYEGSASPYRAGLHEVRPFAGTIHVAERMIMLLEGSEILESHKNCGRVQDPYSFRCVPQVHGASRNAYQHLLELTEIELNSVTDNPIVFSADEVISGGNFHGQPLAMTLDYASIAAAELGNISDRRSYLLLEGKFGLPRLLTPEPGLNSGFMIPQYATAALVTENKSLCFPPSADSVPTSLGQEDHVSMGSISGRKFNQILENLEKILAIELMIAAQGIEFRRPKKSSAILEENLNIIRQAVPKLENDRLLYDDIDTLIQLVKNRAFKTQY